MNKLLGNDIDRRNERIDRQRGFSIMQLLITLVIAGVVSAFALIGISKSRDHVRLQNSVRQLASFIEKARLDAIRRHGTASVTFTNGTTYNVQMDFDGMGNLATRSFSFESGVGIITSPLPSVTFNWRGRTSQCTITFALQNTGGEQSWVDVSDAGDLTINSDVDVLPTVSYANVNTTVDVVGGTVSTGSGVHNNVADCGDTGGTVVVPPPITGTGSSCTMTGNPSALTIKKAGGSTGTVTVSTTGSGTFTVSKAGPSNLTISPTSRTIAGGSSATFAVTSNNKTRGTFAVNFASSCTTVTVSVKVIN